jgi:hypothetical protein
MRLRVSPYRVDYTPEIAGPETSLAVFPDFILSYALRLNATRPNGGTVTVSM